MLINKIHREENKSFVVKILGILALIMLIAMLVRSLTFDFNITISFTSFLEYMSKAPNVFPDLSISDFSIYADWGLFNFLRDFFNIFTNLFGVVTWLAIMVTRCLIFLFYILRFFFV